MVKFPFFYDECFNDEGFRGSNLIEKGTTGAGSSFDSYVGVFWGNSEKNIPQVIELIQGVHKTHATNGQSEIKSSRIGQKKYVHGLASFSSKDIEFYSDVFRCVLEPKHKPRLHIVVPSKMEIFWKSVFPPGVISSDMYEGFIYSLTKISYNYKLQEVFSYIESAAKKDHPCTGEKLTEFLSADLKEISHYVKNAPRKEQEVIVIQTLCELLPMYKGYVRCIEKSTMPYIIPFDGLMLFLREISVNSKRAVLYIDRYDKTVLTAQKYGFGDIHAVDSKQCSGIWLSDWLAGFIGRMMRAVNNDEGVFDITLSELRENRENCDIDSLRILSPSWFEFGHRVEVFNLYRQAANTYLQPHYWTFLHTAYCDHIVQFTSLLMYFLRYESYDDYKKVGPKSHAQMFNELLIMRLKKAMPCPSHRAAPKM